MNCIAPCRELLNSLPYDSKCPIILNRDHRLKELFVWGGHNNIKHLGEPQT